MGMRTIIESIPIHVIDLIEKLRRQLCDLQFSRRHRVRPEDFTRERQLSFPVVMLFVLQKTVKSIQRHLHEFLNELAADRVFEPVTTGAWTHARAKLRHTAFIELNQTTVLPSVYGPESEARLRRWRGPRVLGLGGGWWEGLFCGGAGPLPHDPSRSQQGGSVAGPRRSESGVESFEFAVGIDRAFCLCAAAHRRTGSLGHLAAG